MDKYAECLKSHSHMEGKIDGCQEYMDNWKAPLTCEICRCHRNFHRKVEFKFQNSVVYTKCRKIHEFKFQNSVDGCQEFITRNKEGSIAALTCDICSCHKSFHEKETIT